MPDPVLLLEALAAAAFLAAAVLLLSAWPWRAPHPVRGSAGALFGVALGFAAGCWVFGVKLHWPPREDQERWLLLLLPAVLVVELAAATMGRGRGLFAFLRLLIALGAARLLLHNSIYLEELAGPGSREWTALQTWCILAALAAALIIVWAALLVLVRSPALSRGAGSGVVLAVAFTLAGAAVTVMLSGYATAGQVGLLLAAALTGAAAVAALLPGSFSREGVLGVGIVGLFALLVLGRFFGQLPTDYGAGLFFGLLLCWLPDLSSSRRLGVRLRGVSRLLLAALPVMVVIILAQQRFVRESAHTSSDSSEVTADDYLNSGK